MDIADNMIHFAEWLANHGTRVKLLREIDAYIEVTGVSEKVFGHRAVNDSGLVPRLRDGSGCTIDRLDACRWFMRRNLTKTQLAMFNNLIGEDDGQ